MKNLKNIHEHKNNIKDVSKNILLTLVLLLTVSFAFAGNDVEKVSIYDVEETVELTNSVEITDGDFTMEINDISLLDTSNIATAPGDILIICEYIGDGWWYCEVYVEME